MGDDDLTAEDLAELQNYLSQSGMGSGYPVPEKDKSMVGFFRDIADYIKGIKKTFRVANFSDEELETARIYLDTAHYAETVGLTKVGKFLEDEALIISDTSLGKEGFLIRAAITTKRETVSRLGELGKKKKSGWSLFGKKTKEEGE